VFAAAGALRVWLNNGAGTFVYSGQELSGGDGRKVVLGDVDGDGDLDAFVANLGGGSGEGNMVWLNTGIGNFIDSGQSLGSSASKSVELGDLDGDGDLDAFVANYNFEANKVWLNDGSGVFTDSGQSLGANDSRDVMLGDLDGDGDLDAFVANRNLGVGEGNGRYQSIMPATNNHCIVLFAYHIASS